MSTLPRFSYQALIALLLFLTLALAAGGCKKEPEADPFFETWRQLAKESQGHSPPISKHEADRLAQSRTQRQLLLYEEQTEQIRRMQEQAAEEREAEAKQRAKVEHESRERMENYLDRRFAPMPTDLITLEMYDAPLPALLRALAGSVSLNALVSPSVTGTITVNFKDTPWDEAFESIMRTYGLRAFRDGTILRVLTTEDMAADAEAREAETKIVEGEIESMQKMAELKQAPELAKTRVEQMIRQAALAAPPVTRLIKIKYADAADLKGNLYEYLYGEREPSLSSAKSGDAASQTAQAQPAVPGSEAPAGEAAPQTAPSTTSAMANTFVVVDSHTNSLVLHGNQADVQDLTELIHALDRPTAQVQLKAYIVETTDETARALGVQWGADLSYNNFFGGENLSVGPGQLIQGVDENYMVNFPSGTISDEQQGFATQLAFGKIGGNMIQAQLQALEQANKLKILSSPSLITLDNQTAYTENGEEVPYVTIDEDGTRTVEFKDAVLRLEITPRLIDEEYLKMEITVKKDEVDFSRVVDGNPVIIKKETSTKLVARDKETVVISGLTKRTGQDKENGLPGAKDVPLLGWLFKGEDKSDRMEEVLIFITPYVLDEWQPGEKRLSAKEMQERLELEGKIPEGQNIFGAE